MRTAKVGLFFEKEAMQQRWKFGINVFQLYMTEILEHAGISYTVFEDIRELPSYDVVIAGLFRDVPEHSESLWTFVSNGGLLISYKGLNKWAGRLGCRRSQRAGAGYARFNKSPLLSDEALRYLEAEIWEIADPTCSFLASATGTLLDACPDGEAIGAALLSFTIGEGCLHRWAVDVPSLIVQFQQGDSPVLEDGMPSKDGSGAVDDGILKADDRFVLDWELDRTETDSGLPLFKKPYADIWRELIIGQLLSSAAERGLTIPFIDTWPAGMDYVATISLDSDLNDNAAAEATLDLLSKLNINTTWCMIAPGYEQGVYNRAKQDGHELALHYNAYEKDGGSWSREAFQAQYDWVKEAAGVSKIVSNKNHYTRYEGWGELYQWCEACGIELDQTRGPSKRGNLGFLFGTCQPYRPIAWFDESNRLYDVLELGFLSMDINFPGLGDESIVAPLLEEVQRVRGAAHFLFHHYHIHHQTGVKEALIYVVEEAKRRGFSFWTSEELNAWERHRRTIRMTCDENGAIMLERDIASIMPELELAVWAPASLFGHEEEVETAYRYGILCRKINVSRRRHEHDRKDD